jgi:hypothetical protein
MSSSLASALRGSRFFYPFAAAGGVLAATGLGTGGLMVRRCALPWIAVRGDPGCPERGRNQELAKVIWATGPCKAPSMHDDLRKAMQHHARPCKIHAEYP